MCTTPKVLTLQESQFWNILKILGEESTRGGAPTVHGGGGHAPCLGGHLAGPQHTSSAIWCLLPWKYHKEALGTKRRRLEAEPGQDQSWAPAELFCRGNIPSRGGNHRHHHHHRSSHGEGVNLHQHLHQHHLLSNPSSSLVSDLCLKTSYWYLWVASSVDYSL